MQPDSAAIRRTTFGLTGLAPSWPRIGVAQLRDRLVSSPAFRAWAARFPLTRFIARRRTAELFDLCAGFVYAQVLYACMQGDLFVHLADGPRSLQDLAARLDLPLPGAECLLDAAVSLRLAEKRKHGTFGLGPLGAALIGNAGVAAMVSHHAMLYADLADPLAVLRGNADSQRLSAYWAYARDARSAALGRDKVEGYTSLMADSQPLVAREILDAYDIRQHRCLMDVGGGNGSFIAAAAEHAPRLQMILFDLPAVVALAQQRLAAGSGGSRVQCVGGSFLEGPLPTGADLITLVRVIHDHDDENVMTLLRLVHAALPRGGRLVVGEPLAGTRGAERMGAYFGLYLRAMGSGRPRSFRQLAAMLAGSGFTHVERRPTHTPLLTSVIIARAG